MLKQKVKELAIEAGFEFDGADCNFYSPHESQWINREVYGFADSIVNECLAVLRKAQEEGKPASDYESIIRKHFQ